MPNTQYLKGRNREYKTCEKLRQEGFHIVQRTAGSHSPMDIIAIDFHLNRIKLVQVKPKDMPDAQKQRILEDNKSLGGKRYYVEFEVR